MMMLAVIFGIQILYVSFSTVRMIVMLKGLRTIASLLSMVEVSIYVLGLSLVLERLQDPVNLVVYCLGYGAGVVVGSMIEERMALGYLTVQIITNSTHDDLPQQMRSQGFGVTTWHGEGRDGQRLMMQVLTKRKNHNRLMQFLDKADPHAFVISHEPKNFRGGFWSRLVR